MPLDASNSRPVDDTADAPMLLKLRDAARAGDLTAFVPPRFPSARRSPSAVNAYSAAAEDDGDADFDASGIRPSKRPKQRLNQS
jgi:hypothetical protein